MEKINLLKKSVPISALILILLYLVRTFLILPIFIPFARELNLIDCRGIGFISLCNYNYKGWIVLYLLVFIIVFAVVCFLESRKKTT